MLSQFSSLQSSQETLSTLATDTGGEAFLDTNDFAPAFTQSPERHVGVLPARLQQHEPRAGREVPPHQGEAEERIARLQARGARRLLRELRLRAPREGGSPAPTRGRDQLRRVVNGSSRRRDDELVPDRERTRSTCRCRLPCPARTVHAPAPTAKDNKNATLDLLGVMTDEQGRVVGKIQDTMQIPATQTADLAGKELQYQSGVTLPAGHFKVKVAVRENTDGTLGTFEFPITIPDLKHDRRQGEPDRAEHAAALRARRRTRTRRPWRGRTSRRIRRTRRRRWRWLPEPARRRQPGVRQSEPESTAARRPGNRAEPDARRDAGPADVLLLRGLRSDDSTRPARRSCTRASRSIAAA